MPPLVPNVLKTFLAWLMESANVKEARIQFIIQIVRLVSVNLGMTGQLKVVG